MKLEEIKMMGESKILAVYGAGLYAQRFCEYFAEDNIQKNVEAFIVSDKEGNPQEICNVPVLTLSELPQCYYEGVLIIALSKNNRKSIAEVVKKFHKILFIEEIMSTAFLQDGTKGNRNTQIQNYYENFKAQHPLFKYVEIETINRCNGSCGFCPVNINEDQRPYCKMSDELFYSIVDELEQLQYNGRVALFSNNEAFLDNRIIKFAEYTRKKLPYAHIYITTNGTLLNCDNFLEIIPYLDSLNIDIYKNNSDEDDPQNIAEILALAQSNNWSSKIRVSRISRTAIRSSRGGKSPNSKVVYTIEDKCPLLFVQIVIRPDGKISLCCNDALGTMTLGDLTKMSLKEVWESDYYNLLREKSIQSRANIDLCRFCDYVDMREL